MGDCGIKRSPLFVALRCNSCNSPDSWSLSARLTLAFRIPLGHRSRFGALCLSYDGFRSLTVRTGDSPVSARVYRDRMELQACVCYGIQERHEWEEVTGDQRGGGYCSVEGPREGRDRWLIVLPLVPYLSRCSLG